jgi:predicted O-methyltransferase YrrM
MRYDPDEYLARVPKKLVAGAMNDYSLTEDDMRVAVALFREHGVRYVLEFGVNDGNTAVAVLRLMPEVERYVGVDLVKALFPERGIVPITPGWRADGDPRFIPVAVDGTPDCFGGHLRRTLEQLGVDAFDALIMDADHEEKPTQRDTELCWPFLRQGGLCLWHDYGVHSRQHDNGKDFPLKAYLDRLIASGRQIHTPDQQSRDPWTCVSVAWEVKL